jgi:hypothetical protein
MAGFLEERMGFWKLLGWKIFRSVYWYISRLGKMKEKQWRSIINERELEIKIRDPGIELEGVDKKRWERDPSDHFMRRRYRNVLYRTHVQ